MSNSTFKIRYSQSDKEVAAPWVRLIRKEDPKSFDIYKTYHGTRNDAETQLLIMNRMLGDVDLLPPVELEIQELFPVSI